MDDEDIFNGSISAKGYILNTLVGTLIGGFTGGIGSSTFSLTLPTLSLAQTSIGTTALVVGASTVTVNGAYVAAGLIGLGVIAFSKGNGPRMGHNQHENRMFHDIMNELDVTDKDLMRRLHDEIHKYPYKDKYGELLKLIKNILERWGKI